MKRCKKCRVLKVLDDFYRNPGARDGRRPECKAGTNAVRLQRYRLNRDQGIARVRAWQRAHPERVRARRENNRNRTNAKPREIHLRNKFGLTPAQYDDILEAQGGVCALCDAPPTQGISLHVDHDHRTGEIRGLLCVRCNNALGVFREHPDLLRRAARYVTADAKASVATAQLGTARPRAGARVAGRRGVR
jgi:hypothetical protein